MIPSSKRLFSDCKLICWVYIPNEDRKQFSSLQIFPYKYVHWDIHLKVQYLPWVDSSLDCGKANKIRMELSFTIGEKFFVKSTSRICVNFQATKQALYQSMEPLTLVLILKTRLKFTICLLVVSVRGQLPCVELVLC